MPSCEHPLGWLNWFVRTYSQSKKNGVSVSNTENDSVDLNDESLTEKENSLRGVTRTLPLLSQGKYFIFAANV